jgi:hypothetical protein
MVSDGLLQPAANIVTAPTNAALKTSGLRLVFIGKVLQKELCSSQLLRLGDFVPNDAAYCCASSCAQNTAAHDITDNSADDSARSGTLFLGSHAGTTAQNNQGHSRNGIECVLMYRFHCVTSVLNR